MGKKNGGGAQRREKEIEDDKLDENGRGLDRITRVIDVGLEGLEVIPTQP